MNKRIFYYKCITPFFFRSYYLNPKQSQSVMPGDFLGCGTTIVPSSLSGIASTFEHFRQLNPVCLQDVIYNKHECSLSIPLFHCVVSVVASSLLQALSQSSVVFIPQFLSPLLAALNGFVSAPPFAQPFFSAISMFFSKALRSVSMVF